MQEHILSSLFNKLGESKIQHYTHCIIQSVKKSGINGNFIYYLHYTLYIFTPTLYAFSQLLYHACADFAQHIGIDSSTTVCNSLPKVTKISDFNIIHQP
jgi:hypothetical protein